MPGFSFGTLPVLVVSVPTDTLLTCKDLGVSISLPYLYPCLWSVGMPKDRYFWFLPRRQMWLCLGPEFFWAMFPHPLECLKY